MLLCLLLLWFQNPAALVREHVNKGLELSQKGDLQAANTHLEKALKLEPSDVQARYYLAINQYRLEEFARAKSNVERILAGKPDMKPAILLLGAVLEKLKDYRRAINLMESVLDLVRQQPEWIAVLARCYYHAGLVKKGRETVEWLRYAGPAAVFLGAEAAEQSGDLGTAEKLLASIRSTGQDRGRFGYELSMVQYRSKQFAESQATLEQLIAAGTQEARVFNLLAWCHHRQGRPTEAVAAMKRAIELDPAAEANYDDLAQIMMEEGGYADAREVVQKALSVAPNSSPAFQLKGRAEAGIGDYKLALQSYTRAADLDPANAEALLGLGLAHQNLFQYGEAAASFEKGIARFPENPQFYQAYGRMLLDSGMREARAVALLEKALALDDHLADAHYELGKYLLGKDEVTAAMAHLEAAERLDPQNGRIPVALAGAYRRVGRKAEAMEQLRKFKELEALKKSSAPPQ